MWKDSKTYEYYITRLVLVGLVLILGYFGAKIIGNVYEGKLTKEFSSSTQAMQDDFREQIAEQTDAYAAAKMGQNFLVAQNDDLGLLAFQKATDLDPNWRDGWVWRGYAELKNNQSSQAIVSLKRAAEIDPINARTYELLAIAYRATGDSDSAKKAEEKYNYLKEHSQ